MVRRAGGLWRGKRDQTLSGFWRRRRSSFSRKLAFEEPTKAVSIRDGEECWLSNGARGFFVGRVSIQEPSES